MVLENGTEKIKKMPNLALKIEYFTPSRPEAGGHCWVVGYDISPVGPLPCHPYGEGGHPQPRAASVDHAQCPRVDHLPRVRRLEKPGQEALQGASDQLRGGGGGRCRAGGVIFRFQKEVGQDR